MADGRRGGDDWRGENSRDAGDRGFFERAGDELRPWLGDENDRSKSGRGDYDGDEQAGSSRRRAGSSMEDHYRSWRDRQMAELDRDYDDYCRERQQQFHSEFSEWRQKRRSSPRSGQELADNSGNRGGSVPPTFGFPGASASTGSSGSAHPSDAVTADTADAQAGTKRTNSRSGPSRN